MNRRGLGFSIAAVAAVALLTVVGVVHRTRAGFPLAAAIPPAPSVGDCLLDETVVSWLYNENPAFSPRRLSACTGQRYGEVVAVIDDSRPAAQIATASLAVTHPRGTISSKDPILPQCSAALDTYLGLPSDARGDGQDTWAYAGSVVPAVAGPDDVQKAAGQHWVACLASALDPDHDTGTAFMEAQPYAYSARAAYVGQHPPHAFALCTPSMILPSILQPSDCSAPHSVEIFGVTQTHGRSVTQAQLVLSCRQLVRELTGMPDPTAGGRLQVAAAALHATAGGGEENGLSTAPDAAGFAICMVVTRGKLRLAGALLGLGAAPVPWA